MTGYVIERCDVSRGRWVRVNREKVCSKATDRSFARVVGRDFVDVGEDIIGSKLSRLPEHLLRLKVDRQLQKPYY